MLFFSLSIVYKGSPGVIRVDTDFNIIDIDLWSAEYQLACLTSDGQSLLK